MEDALARWCVLELDIGSAALRALFPSPRARAAGPLDRYDLDGRVDEERYRLQWGPWRGREHELYAQAARLVAPLRWADVIRTGGADVAVRARMVCDAYDELVSPRLPDRLRLASLRTARSGPRTVRVETYTPYDPLDLPAELVPALATFDGSLPTSRCLRRIHERFGLALERDLLQRLVDFEILVDAGDARATSRGR